MGLRTDWIADSCTHMRLPWVGSGLRGGYLTLPLSSTQPPCRKRCSTMLSASRNIKPMRVTSRANLIVPAQKGVKGFGCFSFQLADMGATSFLTKIEELRETRLRCLD